MEPKQREMDGVLERIYDSFATRDKRSLIIVAGDHGMNDVSTSVISLIQAGNHGGSSSGETSTVFPNIYE